MSGSQDRHSEEFYPEEEQVMNEELDTINRMRAITISREYGSGGGEIASRLASAWDGN